MTLIPCGFLPQIILGKATKIKQLVVITRNFGLKGSPLYKLEWAHTEKWVHIQVVGCVVVRGQCLAMPRW